MNELVSSDVFKTWVPVTPERVWAALTCPTATPRFFHGLSATSTWNTGAALTLTAAATPTAPLVGTVLRAEPCSELAFSIDDSSGTTTFVSVALRTCNDGCAVTLTVDECPGGTASGTELEDAWLPVLESLRGVLAGQS